MIQLQVCFCLLGLALAALDRYRAVPSAKPVRPPLLLPRSSRTGRVLRNMGFSLASTTRASVSSSGMASMRGAGR